jgi:hypothetical protein
VEATREISVKAGGSETTSFTASRENPGEYEAEINGQKGTFTISEAPAATTTPGVQVGPPANPKGTNWLLVGLAAAGVVFIAGACVLVLRKKRA